MLSKIKENYYLSFYLISFILMFFSYGYQIEHPPCCDVPGYISLANNYLEQGMFSSSSASNVRLYGFPLYLATLISVFGAKYLVLSYAIINVVIYITFSFLIISELKKYVKSNLLHLAFSLNIFLFPYLVVPLADGLSVLLWMVLFHFILKIIHTENKKDSFIHLFIYSFILGFSIMVRPSNISLITTIPAIFAMLYLVKKQIHPFLVLIILFAGFLLAVVPQIYINFTFFNKLTFLPAMNLGDSQIKWGIEYIKYGTNLSGQGIPQLYYKNPFFLASDGLGVSWYFTNIGNGIKTAFLHIFNVFTYDYYFPYIYDLYPKYKNITLFYSWFILYFGVIGFVNSLIYLITNKSFNKNEKNNLKFLYLLFLIVFISNTAILAVSAVEIRFSLPLVFMLLPFAFYALIKFKSNFKIIGIFALWLLLAYTLNAFVELQKNIPFFQGI